jgi:hypothetical protein
MEVAKARKLSEIHITRFYFMGEQTKTPWPSFSALWSLLWRAVLLMPFALVAGGVWLATWPLLIILPGCEILYLYAHDWLWASVLPVVWMGLFFFARSSWFKANRKDFPNEQENI